MMRRLLILSLLSACATAPARPKAAPPSVSNASIQPIRSEEDYAADRADFDALEPGARDRAARRAALRGFFPQGDTRALGGGHLEEGGDALKQAPPLYDAGELRHGGKDPPLLEATQRFERALRPRGAHQLV